MHTVSKKDLNKSELETVRVPKNPTVVLTVNCEVLTKEEATVYVRELDLLVTVMLLEDTPAVLLLGKLCEDHGGNYLPLDQWSVTTSHQQKQKISNATRRTTYHSLSLVYRQALQAHLHQHLHRRKP